MDKYNQNINHNTDDVEKEKAIVHDAGFF